LSPTSSIDPKDAAPFRRALSPRIGGIPKDSADLQDGGSSSAALFADRIDSHWGLTKPALKRAPRAAAPPMSAAVPASSPSLLARSRRGHPAIDAARPETIAAGARGMRSAKCLDDDYRSLVAPIRSTGATDRVTTVARSWASSFRHPAACLRGDVASRRRCAGRPSDLVDAQPARHVPPFAWSGWPKHRARVARRERMSGASSSSLQRNCRPGHCRRSSTIVDTTRPFLEPERRCFSIGPDLSAHYLLSHRTSPVRFTAVGPEGADITGRRARPAALPT